MRYILFAHSEFYYAKGGGHDYLGSGNYVDSLVQYAKDHDFLAWWHVFDTVTRKIVAASRYQAYGIAESGWWEDGVDIYE
jgi:hypothetical protein